ncbi:hypothetical protein LTR17_005321 [Elasticomyces elasticus]|nr:hypothetical protein LTR17_005321 [Elasticomyces elasticus]
MAPEKSDPSASRADEGDLVKAFQELAKGERTAAALENQLSSMEAKIEALLAEAEKEQQEVERMRAGRLDGSAGGSDQESEQSNEQQ